MVISWCNKCPSTFRFLLGSINFQTSISSHFVEWNRYFFKLYTRLAFNWIIFPKFPKNHIFNKAFCCKKKISNQDFLFWNSTRTEPFSFELERKGVSSWWKCKIMHKNQDVYYWTPCLYIHAIQFLCFTFNKK